MIRPKYLFFTVIGILFLLSYCKSYNRNKSFQKVPANNIRRGEALAQQYCQSCHISPDPSLLDAKTWNNGVLPHMAPLLGIFNHGFQQYPSSKNDRWLDTSYYPRQPLLSPVDWQNLIDYYTATAPDSLPAQQREKPIAYGLSLFEAQQPANTFFPPATCFVKIDTSGPQHFLIFANNFSHNIYRFNTQMQLIDSVNTGGPVVDINFQQERMVVCDIGEMNPNNGKFGKIRQLTADKKGKWQADTTALITGLARPVQVTAADLDGDSLQDFIVCEFGFMTGNLSWFQNMGNNQFKRHILRPFPGAIQLLVRDVNNDHLPDLWVLFSQGEEGVFLFTNKGNGRFDQRQVLRMPPSYGSTFFELVDFNKDGHEDIVYTCGDNADYSPVLKPYHGVYVFLNNGKNEFKQDLFFPINGCYKALARDFDNDGDLDIAAISFFADYATQPQEGFVYLDNRNGVFYPLSIPEATSGRWLTMDAGDLDGDGKTDLVLGNFSQAPTMFKLSADWSRGPDILFLKNTGRRNN